MGMPRHTCRQSPSGLFSGFCTPPILYGCPPLPFPPPQEAGKPPLMQAAGWGTAHGTVREISCAAHAVPIDGRFPVDSWGEHWYEGNHSTTAVCNNGTWLRVNPFVPILQPAQFACASREQLQLFRDMHHDADWTRKELIASEASGIGEWIDTAATERKAALRRAHAEEAALYSRMLAYSVPTTWEFKKCIGDLHSNIVGPPKGKKRDLKVCLEFGEYFPMHSLLISPSPAPVGVAGKSVAEIPFLCQYTIQKTPVGADPITSLPTYKYRDGCFCESKWPGLCPFRADQSPSYKEFGFDAVDERPVFSEPGAPPTGALCWYWSPQLHPEYGFEAPKERPGGPEEAPAPAPASAVSSE